MRRASSSPEMTSTVEAGAPAHRFDELLRVLRLAHRAGGDGAHNLSSGPSGNRQKVLDGGGAGLDGLGRETAGDEGVVAQADHGLFAGQDLEGSVLFHGGDEQLDAVGADVDGGQRLHRA